MYFLSLISSNCIGNIALFLPPCFLTSSVQVQTDDKRPRTASAVITRGQLGAAASQMSQNNKPKKPVDEQFERTTK